MTRRRPLQNRCRPVAPTGPDWLLQRGDPDLAAGGAQLQLRAAGADLADQPRLRDLALQGHRQIAGHGTTRGLGVQVQVGAGCIDASGGLGPVFGVAPPSCGPGTDGGIDDGGEDDVADAG